MLCQKSADSPLSNPLELRIEYVPICERRMVLGSFTHYPCRSDIGTNLIIDPVIERGVLSRPGECAPFGRGPERLVAEGRLLSLAPRIVGDDV